ncbi:MAG: eukaryotic-like serine/threonine-protein kinase [Acidobacteriota bacterium]|jgi:serine/threonine protein kinase|nr:eukaryotic-like serine/threonine-protein kinase [Acidobacteriota bacterium]MDT7778481.1 eukaryotic-like serine/threonine-protein kinase [Acidobacteriota bacterium]
MSELKLQQCRLDGRYNVLDCLGRGSYSEVYVAEDMAAAEGSPRIVVIKALNTHLQGVPDTELERTLVENFRNEAIALDRVRHPNIISRLGHGTALDLQGRTFHYLVVEYLPGGDLQALVRNHPLPLDAALFYLEQICLGLAHAHKHGVIHRDIKPQNLLLTADQQTIKIADFGVAKIEAVEGAITRVGTDVYAAPEHHPLATTGPLETSPLTRRVIQLTPAADIYSLAKTTYMLLTGEAPRRFSQKPITQLPQDFSGEDWSRYVLRVLERATQTNQDRRYQTVEEFWREIKDATMAQTRPLRRGEGGAGSPQGDDSDTDGFSTTPPPAPTFDRQSRPADTAQRHRIVVPISHTAPVPEFVARAESSPFPARQTGPDVSPEPFHAEPYRDPSVYDARRGARLSSAARRWAVALLLLLAFSGMLFATYRYVNNLRHGVDPQQKTQTSTSDNNRGIIGNELVTPRDVNLRKGPDPSYTKIGLAESGSRVRVLQVNGKWYQVQIVEHGRAKEDPESEDQGWLNGTLLKTQQ